MKRQSLNWQQPFFFFAFQVFKVASRVLKAIALIARSLPSLPEMLACYTSPKRPFQSFRPLYCFMRSPSL